MRKYESDLKFVAEVCKKIDVRIDGLKEVYTKKEYFEREINKFAAQKDFSDIKNKMGHFAKEADVMKIISDLKSKMDGIRNKMEKSYATKNEVRDESNKLSQAVGNHYLSMSNFNDFRERQEKKVSDHKEAIEALRVSLSNHTKHITTLKK